MKLGPFDGSVQEVKDLMENNGLKLEDYLEKPPIPLRNVYIVLPILLLGVTLISLSVFKANLNHIGINISYIISFAAASWLTVSIQLKYKNGVATFCTGVGSVIVILLAAGLISPQDTIRVIKDVRGN